MLKYIKKMKRNYLGFNSWGNNGTYGRTSIACGLGKMRNTVGSTTRIYNYCSRTSVDPLACLLNFLPNSGSNSNSGSTKTIPSSPTITSIVSGNNQLIVNFIAPTYDGGSPITNYLYSTDNGASFTSSELATSPITITGLINGTTYNVVIRAVNSIGTGAPSNSYSATPSTVPNPPTSLSATTGNTEATISFTAGSNGGSAITDYLYSTNGVTYVSSGDSTSPITITGLTNGVTYNITLKAVNANGNSIASIAVSVTPNNVVVPLAPVLTGISFKTTDSMTITFTQASNGITITNYKYSLNGGPFFPLSPVDTSSPVTINGLASNTSYDIRLRAVSAVGDGDVSNTLTDTTYTNVNYASFTTPGTTTWTAPTGVTFVQYLIVGGGGGGGAAYSKINVLGNILVTDVPQAGAYWINSANLTNGRYSGRMYYGNNTGQNSSSFADPIRLTASQKLTPTGVIYDYNKWYNSEIVYSLTSALVSTTNWIPPYQVNSTYCNNSSGGGGGGSGGKYSIQGGTNKYNVVPGTTYTIIVGAGGAGGIGGSNTETNGSPGGDSSFDTVIMQGGSGGSYSRNASQNVDAGKYGKGGNGGQAYGNLVGGSGGGQTSSNNYGLYNSGGAGFSGAGSDFDGNGTKYYGRGGNGGVPNNVTIGTTTANVGKGGNGTGALLNSFANGLAGGSGIVMLKYYT
jgi:Fibronectin type III domain